MAVVGANVEIHNSVLNREPVGVPQSIQFVSSDRS